MQNIPKPDRVNLLSFLRSTILHQFVIPVYQRNYAWTSSKEVNQYMTDIKSVIDDDYDTHFLGIIIYLMNPVDALGSIEFSVIDGQQRLTTTFLILYAIKNIMMENGMSDEAITFDNTTLSIPNKTGVHRYRLKPLVSDDNVYQQIVGGNINQIIETNSNVYKNYIYIKNRLESWIKLGLTVNDVLLALDKLYVVSIPIGENDNAQKIFESINSTGAKLTSADLIRNYILMDLPSIEQDRLYNDYWKKIEHFITSDAKKLAAFFRFFLAIKTYTLINKSAVYREFKIWFNEEIKKSSKENVLRSIVTYAKYYHEIYSKDIIEPKTNLEKTLVEFRLNISDMPAPFLMEVFNLHYQKDENDANLIDEQTVSEIFNLINTYLIRRALTGLDTSDITRLFPKLLKDTLNDCKGNYSNIVDYVKRNLINRNRGKSSMMPDDQTLKNYLKNANAYNIKFTLRIVFEKLENYNNSAPVDQRKLSVEHLLPQTPTQYWLDITKLYVRDEYEKYLNKLGNLTLASKKDNSRMKNNVFEYKKDILQTTNHLNINKDVLNKKTWNKDDIDDRTEELIDKILKFYPYTSASEDVIIKHSIFLYNNGVSANAYLYEEDGSVEILEGSIISKNADNTAFQSLEELYSELVEDGIIVELDEYSIFKKSYLIPSTRLNDTSLSSTASLILRSGSKNGWDCWKDSNGFSLNENHKLKSKLTKRK